MVEFNLLFMILVKIKFLFIKNLFNYSRTLVTLFVYTSLTLLVSSKTVDLWGWIWKSLPRNSLWRWKRSMKGSKPGHRQGSFGVSNWDYGLILNSPSPSCFLDWVLHSNLISRACNSSKPWSFLKTFIPSWRSCSRTLKR